ncbi:CGNR zinc finger domain-containing protein [Nocardioides sp. J2M5]|uniref:CGNR zinc finger domain-containing protein n=1 Tax=Nocardioides palaemonis TaxID=2829810 RepID=UPI001BAC4989|nr:CGNR zinc finger domain-containing protein [Nocardioides palaemonis]MBS2939386.1 CGNR zinc finger domain-containing protein [Nocardioides palaemonis]
MDFLRYAERSAALVNAELADEAALREHLADRSWLHRSVVATDVAALESFRAELRPVFEASQADDVRRVVSQLNDLLARHPVTPMISDHDPANLHMHVANRAASVAELLIGEALMGLATLVCDLGATRLGTCSEPRCDHVFVDTSPNQSRRYCSDRCSSRANVAAFRARQKAVREQPEDDTPAAAAQ